MWDIKGYLDAILIRFDSFFDAMQIRFHHPGDDISATIYPHYDNGLPTETLRYSRIHCCMRVDGSASSTSPYLSVSDDVAVLCLCQMVTFEARGSGGAVHPLDTSSPRP